MIIICNVLLLELRQVIGLLHRVCNGGIKGRKYLLMTKSYEVTNQTILLPITQFYLFLQKKYRRFQTQTCAAASRVVGMELCYTKCFKL